MIVEGPRKTEKMTERPKHTRQKWLPALALFGFALATPTSSLAQEIKPEEIGARHLETIGLRDTKTTKRGAQELQRMLPDVRIVR